MRSWPGFGSLAVGAAALACGARTGLDVGAAGGGEVGGGGAGYRATRAEPSTTNSSQHDLARDASNAWDAKTVGRDAATTTVAPGCVDSGITYIYVVTQWHELYRFYPPTATFDLIGTVSCPDTQEFYSMAVDRKGIAHVVLMDGSLVRVSTATASCQSTPFAVGQHGFTTTFGMGFVADTGDSGETLFVAGTSSHSASATGQPINVAGKLGTIDLQTYDLNVVGAFSTDIGDAEPHWERRRKSVRVRHHGSSPGTLQLAQVDKRTASIVHDTSITFPSVTTALSGWAFAYWGGDFFFFTSTDNLTSVVSRYTPGGSRVVTAVATLDKMIVGAGVSTCAPVD